MTAPVTAPAPQAEPVERTIRAASGREWTARPGHWGGRPATRREGHLLLCEGWGGVPWPDLVRLVETADRLHRPAYPLPMGGAR